MLLTAMLGAALGSCATADGGVTQSLRERIARSPQWDGERVVTPEPMWSNLRGALFDGTTRSPHVHPREPLPVVPVAADRFATPPADGLRVTWLGHSTFLVELDGHRVLTDPVWSERASPVQWAGPQRWVPPPLALADLPALDAVVISHDHYDHLDRGTVEKLGALPVPFVVPLGVGDHLRGWGIPAARIVELDWWESSRFRDLELTLTPARHASGRTALIGANTTLWGGFALRGPRHRVYFSGDTGLFPGMGQIGTLLRPFDVTLIESGAYSRFWPDWHIGPEQAVRAHQLVRGQLLIPAHWGSFALAQHGWTEPAERLIAAAAEAGVQIAIPRHGESVTGSLAPPLVRWWPGLPWNTADDDPIVSSRNEGAAGDLSLAP